jgi:AcrR family transcriptional regulator
VSRTKLKTGRVNQKLRTRKALFEAARQLMEQGKEPSIDEVAEVAMVSRATAYRYFPNHQTLIMEAMLDAKFADAEEVLRDADPQDAAERAARVNKYLFDLDELEVPLRLFLSASLSDWVKSDGKADVRSGRRVPMLELALEPVREQLDEDSYKKLLHALTAMVGIEAYVALRDVAKLSPEESKEVMGWAVKVLVNAVAKR